MDTFFFGRLPLEYSFYAAVVWSGIWALVLIAICVFMGVSDDSHPYVGGYLTANFWFIMQTFIVLCTVCSKEIDVGFFFTGLSMLMVGYIISYVIYYVL